MTTVFALIDLCISTSFSKCSLATDAGVYSGIWCASGDLGNVFVDGEFSIFEEALLERLGRGGVAPPTLCNELIEVFFCSSGVEDLRSGVRELELGGRRRGD